MSLNKVMLIGGCGKDPEIREANGAKVASFSLATSERYKDRNGELHENVEWHNIVCWRNLAETCEKYVHKGDKLYVEGKLRTRSYETNGEKRYTTEIVADKIEFCGSKDQAGQRPSGQPTQQDGDINDIPF